MKQAGVSYRSTKHLSWNNFRRIYGNYVEQVDRELSRIDFKALRLGLGLATEPPHFRFASRAKPFPLRRFLKSDTIVMKLG